MNKIEVSILHQSHLNPAGMMMFLAKLTQRGHQIKCMEDLMQLYDTCLAKDQPAAASVAALPHGTIKRFSPITVAIVGASRRFLSQIRTHQVGISFVSASLQYSNYSGEASYMIPYNILKADNEIKQLYVRSCDLSLLAYESLIKLGIDNDSAGYGVPQGLRNILIIQANHDAWQYIIRLRGCNRNTEETQYIVMRIWEELLNTADGKEMFRYAGPDCCYGNCREGRMSCGKSMDNYATEVQVTHNATIPALVIEYNWPLLRELIV